MGAEGGLGAHHAGVGDGGVGEEKGLELGGCDLVAGDFDEFLWEMSQRGFRELI